MIDGVVHRVVDIMRPPHTHRTTWCCCWKRPCGSRRKRLVRHSTFACSRCSSNTNYTPLLRGKCFRVEFTILQKYGHDSHIFTEPPTYIIVLCTLDSNVPHQARLFSHSASYYIRKLSSRTMRELCRKLNSPSSHVCMRQSPTNAVTYLYLTHDYDQYRFIMPPSPPFQGDDSVANYSARSSPARQSVTNADTYYLFSLRSRIFCFYFF